MERQAVGIAGLQGWRTKFANAVAKPVARRSNSVSEDDIRSAIGALFLILTLLYLAQAVRELVNRKN